MKQYILLICYMSPLFWRFIYALWTFPENRLQQESMKIRTVHSVEPKKTGRKSKRSRHVGNQTYHMARLPLYLVICFVTSSCLQRPVKAVMQILWHGARSETNRSHCVTQNVLLITDMSFACFICCEFPIQRCMNRLKYILMWVAVTLNGRPFNPNMFLVRH